MIRHNYTCEIQWDQQDKTFNKPHPHTTQDAASAAVQRRHFTSTHDAASAAVHVCMQ